MRVLVQRSNNASVEINNKVVGKIRNGLVLLVGFTDGDNIETIKYIVNKIINLRILPDENDVMNKSILDYGGDILSISQFTLYADTKKGNRPSYMKALRGEESIKLYDMFNEELERYIHVEKGVFGADMIVNISNVGPTTMLLEK